MELTREYILSQITNADGKLIPQRCLSNYLKNHGWYDFIIGYYTDNTTDSIREILYRMVNNIDVPPVCKGCGKPLVFDNGNNRYPQWCSPACRNKDPEVLQKNKDGVSRALKKVYEERGEEVKAKRSATIKEHYGVETTSPFGVKEIQDKAKESLKNNIGVENPFMLKKYRSNPIEWARNKSVNLWKSRGLDIEYTDEGDVIVHNGCPIHGDLHISQYVFGIRGHRRHTAPICLECNPWNTSSGPEVVLSQFFDSLGLKYTMNDRSIISPQELDFYFEEQGIAVEFNGVYFHSTNSGKSDFYHFNKTDKCLGKGIRLIHIWEDDWHMNQEAVLSNLKYALVGPTKEVDLSKCKFAVPSKSDIEDFMYYNSQRGCGKSMDMDAIGIQNEDDEYIGMISYGMYDKHISVIHRFCIEDGYDRVEVGKKLFGRFKDIARTDGADIIEFYESRDYCDTSSYIGIGFDLYDICSPCRFYTQEHVIYDEDARMRRPYYYPVDEYENEMMQDKHYYKCYDSGSYKFIYKP